MNVTATDGDEKVEDGPLDAAGQPDEQQQEERGDRDREQHGRSRPAGVPLAESRPDERQERGDGRRAHPS